MTHDLRDEAFLAEYGSVVEKVKADTANVDLRVFIRDELDGQLVGPLFNQKGRALRPIITAYLTVLISLVTLITMRSG